MIGRQFGIDNDAKAYANRVFLGSGKRIATPELVDLSIFIKELKVLNYWKYMAGIWVLRSGYNAGSGTTAYELKSDYLNGTLVNGPTWGENGIRRVPGSLNYILLKDKITVNGTKQYSCGGIFKVDQRQNNNQISLIYSIGDSGGRFGTGGGVGVLIYMDAASNNTYVAMTSTGGGYTKTSNSGGNEILGQGFVSAYGGIGPNPAWTRNLYVKGASAGVNGDGGTPTGVDSGPSAVIMGSFDTGSNWDITTAFAYWSVYNFSTAEIAQIDALAKRTICKGLNAV